MKLNKRNFKSNKAITLIALVITIIVLLILAGVTIATLTGDNGLLQKVTTAKQANEEASALEKIQVEVAGSYGLDGKIALNDLNKNLKNINGLKYKNKSIVLEGENKNIIEEFPAEISIDNYSFSIKDNGEVINMKQIDLINSKIGEVVQGYSAANLQWQVFYADANETYLISKDMVRDRETIPLKRRKQDPNEIEYEYKGSEDVRKTVFGSKWNKKWLDKCVNDESTYENAKMVAYMCDPINWMEYKDGVANYAVGGPSMELLIASWNKKFEEEVKLDDENVNKLGTQWNQPQGLRPLRRILYRKW